VEKTMQAGLKKPIFMEKQGFFYVIFKRTKLGEKEENILSLIKKKEKITSADVAKLLKISERSARIMLGELVAAGLIKKHGKTKGVFYSI
jgi:predicted HTH transcriptional regulator